MKKFRKLWSPWRVIKKCTSVLLAISMVTGLLVDGVKEIEVMAAQSGISTFSNPVNPVREVDISMTAGQKVTWDCVYFGNYPQTEITSSDSEYSQLINAGESLWDSRGDITINGNTYRRMKKEDAVYTSDEDGYYQWADDTTYHYFKYESIKWRVLNAEDGEVFLLADIVLDDCQYNISKTGVTWETSTIRSWLNGYGSSENSDEASYNTGKNFIDTAFNSNEQSAILISNVDNHSNILYDTDGGNNTKDKIFLLADNELCSTDEANNYGFTYSNNTYDEARRCKSSDYAKAMGVWSSTKSEYAGNCRWWLRSPGSSSYYAIRGYYYGDLDKNYVNYSMHGVRPALRLNLDSIPYGMCSDAGTVCSDGTVTAPEDRKDSEKEEKVDIVLDKTNIEMEVGDTVSLTATITVENTSVQSCDWGVDTGSQYNRNAIAIDGSYSPSGAPVSIGEATITAKTAGTTGVICTVTTSEGIQKSATCIVTVKNPTKTVYLYYDANGGDNAPAPSEIPVELNSSKNTRVDYYTVPTRTGYTFLGWSQSWYATTIKNIR